jgi:hypothetical protein
MCHCAFCIDAFALGKTDIFRIFLLWCRSEDVLVTSSAAVSSLKLMAKEALFSERQGYVGPREIVYRDELTYELRQPIIDILRRSVSREFLPERIESLFNPYGIDQLPRRDGPMIITEDERSATDFTDAKRVLLACEWYRLYDLLEDVFQRLDFHDQEQRAHNEEFQAYPFQKRINDYFIHAGIGWQMVNGKISTRGDAAFEQTIAIATAELKASGRPMAADHIERAICNLSVRPKPDLSGAIGHATAAMECVLHDITGKALTFGDYVKKYPDHFPGAMKKALGSLWGYTSEEARHGKEGVEPASEDAGFVVAIAAAFVTYLNRKRPRP